MFRYVDKEEHHLPSSLSLKPEFVSELFYSNFDRALCGGVENNIFVIPADPGTGKSRGIQQYLRDFVEGKRTVPDAGVIIFLTRLDEIKTYIAGASLPSVKYAVVTADSPNDAALKYGGLLNPSDAPILFTTTQKLKAICRGLFEELEVYHYRGTPRALRIWDEDFTIAEAATVNLDHIAALKVDLRPAFPVLVDALEKVELEAKLIGIGELTIPASVAPMVAAAVRSKPPLAAHQKAILSKLFPMIGKSVRVVSGPMEAPCLVGEHRRLPADIAPLFVFDASARVSDRYSIMERSGVPIERLRTPRVSYRNARFFHLKMGAGKISLRKETSQIKAVYEAANIINKSADDEWIVLHIEDTVFNLPLALKDACKGKVLQFIHWGDHRAKNSLRDIKQVMCIGLQRFGYAGYDEIQVSCGGDATYRDSDAARLRASEIQSLMLQGFARSNMRSHSSGVCGDCVIYILDSEKRLEHLIKDTFPGSRHKEIERTYVSLNAKQREILRYLTGADHTELAAGIRKRDVYRALKIDRSNFGNYVRSPNFLHMIAEHGIIMEKYLFKRE